MQMREQCYEEYLFWHLYPVFLCSGGPRKLTISFSTPPVCPHNHHSARLAMLQEGDLPEGGQPPSFPSVEWRLELG